MSKSNALASIVVAAIVAFIASSVWYGIIFAGVWRTLAPGASHPIGIGEMGAQFVRNLVVAAVLLRVIGLTGSVTLPRAVGVGILCWFGFQAMAIAGSVIHESYPLALYAIHTGDALVTTLLMSFVFGLWPKRAIRRDR